MAYIDNSNCVGVLNYRGYNIKAFPCGSVEVNRGFLNQVSMFNTLSDAVKFIDSDFTGSCGNTTNDELMEKDIAEVEKMLSDVKCEANRIALEGLSSAKDWYFYERQYGYTHNAGYKFRNDKYRLEFIVRISDDISLTGYDRESYEIKTYGSDVAIYFDIGDSTLRGFYNKYKVKEKQEANIFKLNKYRDYINSVKRGI